MGIFRKAGVKSRIAKLRVLVESAGAVNAAFAVENMNTVDPHQSSLNFDGAQAHDVADMVKQYFRELPDALLTNKLSETFIAIFQREFRTKYTHTHTHARELTLLAKLLYFLKMFM